jgi:hypothetical protein
LQTRADWNRLCCDAQKPLARLSRGDYENNPGTAGARTNVIVRTIEDLDALRHQQNLEHVTIDVTKFKYAGLLQHSFRYAFFAVKVGGTITIKDNTPSFNQAIGPHLIGWPTISSIAINALCPECDREPAPAKNCLVFSRVAPPPLHGWSAGIIFSGQDSELPQLFRCLDGLLAQPELQGSNGEILVCGPARDMTFLKQYPQVRYLNFENETTGPFPISKKKNFLLNAMRFHRCIVSHTRITLDPGALSKAPEDFDILSPNVFFDSPHGREPNIGYICIDARWPHLVPGQFERSTTSVDPKNYLTMLKNRIPFVDGGIFAVTKRVLAVCPLNDNLRWGECEDVEWCNRARAHGFLIDMCPEMTATNAVSKVTSLARLPRPAAVFVRTASRAHKRAIRLAQRLKSQFSSKNGDIA